MVVCYRRALFLYSRHLSQNFQRSRHSAHHSGQEVVCLLFCTAVLNSTGCKTIAFTTVLTVACVKLNPSSWKFGLRALLVCERDHILCSLVEHARVDQSSDESK